MHKRKHMFSTYSSINTVICYCIFLGTRAYSLKNVKRTVSQWHRNGTSQLEFISVFRSIYPVQTKYQREIERKIDERKNKRLAWLLWFDVTIELPLKISFSFDRRNFSECVFTVANWSDKKNVKQSETYHDVINNVSNESSNQLNRLIFMSRR